MSNMDHLIDNICLYVNQMFFLFNNWDILGEFWGEEKKSSSPRNFIIFHKNDTILK
jgi:hypothetical protein